MTWHYEADGTELRTWDHTADPTTDPPTVTLSSAGGWTWDGDIPREVLQDAMFGEALDAFQANDTQRMLRILADAAFEKVERYEGN